MEKRLGKNKFSRSEIGSLKSSFECCYRMIRMMNPCISFRFVKMMCLTMTMHGIALRAKAATIGKSGIAVDVTNVSENRTTCLIIIFQ